MENQPARHFITGEIVISLGPKQKIPNNSISVQICSATKMGKDPTIGTDVGKLTGIVRLKNGWRKKVEDKITATFTINFSIEPEFGIPGALFVTNHHKREVYLQSATLHVPKPRNEQTQATPIEQTQDSSFEQSYEESQAPKDHIHIHFDCRSWIYPYRKTNTRRIFFSNLCYLPNQTPPGLREWRKAELESLRGNGTGERKKWDRIYDYDYYNDLGNPDKGEEHKRPVLGGSEHPYPRRGRTGRPPSLNDPSSESCPKMIDLDVYVPHDERLSPTKLSELMSNAIKATALIPDPKSSNSSQNFSSFETFEDIRKMFFTDTNKNDAMTKWVRKELKKLVSNKFYKEIQCKSSKPKPKKFQILIRQKKKREVKKFLLPRIIAEEADAWEDDEEFARQMIAGTNPVRIQSLKEFPPKSKIKEYFNDFDEEIKNKKMFILDHHDYLIPFLSRINEKGTDRIHAYASRTLLHLDYYFNEGVLTPLAIELSLSGSTNREEINQVFLPTNYKWELAKSHVAANDSAYHQLISHWLHTHAVVEPFIIATRRQLSVMHPIHRLLDPHFKDTMHINALARRILLNSGGILEKILFTGEFSMELSSELYKEWRFDEQALPIDLIKRGMAEKVEENSSKREITEEVQKNPSKYANLRLCMEDYPYAVDGLEIWAAIEAWVEDFCNIFYEDDHSVKSDEEIQEWWKEIRNVGHGDKCRETWWHQMTSRSDLTQTLTTLIWIASALHASVNVGQYMYAGYPPNRPTLCRKSIPENIPKNTSADVCKKYHLVMLPQKFEMALGVALMEVLSRHGSDEVYLGQRSSSNWTDNQDVKNKFMEFKKSLQNIEVKILERNKGFRTYHRRGPAQIPYKLMYPDTSNDGPKAYITGKGIPNSISI